MTQDPIRTNLIKLLDWQDAHVSFDTVLKDIPVEMRGKQPEGSPYSLWQLLEHLRIAQHDILEFCQNPNYKEMAWPDDYWPSSPEPPDASAWDDSIKQYHADQKALKQLAANTDIDLNSEIPHGSGQTYLRELLLVADHNAYHVGQLVLVRRLLGIW